MNKKTSLLLCALLLGAAASPSAIAGTMILESFADNTTGPIDQETAKYQMATIINTADKGGNDATSTTVSISGSVTAAQIAEVCVNYGGAEQSCQTNPGSLTNIVLDLPGNNAQKGGSPFTYHVTINTTANPSAIGATISLTVHSIANTNLIDNIPLSSDPTTDPQTIFSSAGVAPTVDTPTYANLTYDNPTWSADLGGTVSDAGTPSNLSGGCGVDWGTAPANPPATTYPNSKPGGVPCSGAGDAFKVNVTGLPSSSTIYFRAWADNGLRDYSNVEGQFDTGSVSEPTVTVSATVLSILADSAFLSGNVTSDGNGTVTDCGIVWDTVADPELSPTKTFKSLGSGTGTCEGTVDGLPPGDTIHYEAYATNSAGTGYSDSNYNFDTLAGPATVTTAVPSSVNATTAVLGGDVTSDGGATVTAKGIVWSTLGAPQVDVDTTVQMGSGTGQFSDTVGDLTPPSDIALPTGQLVHFRAYATNSAGTVYGNERTFIPLGTPDLTALLATNVLLNSGTMRGRLDNANGNNLVDCGVAWGTASGGPYPNLESVGLCTAGVPYDVPLTNLSPGDSIYYKAYATSDLAQTTLSGNQEFFTTLTEPTVQASNVTFPQVSGGAMRISWTRGNGTGAIVVMRLDSVVRADPGDGDDYLGSSVFGEPTAELTPGSTSNFVVYKGSGNSIHVTGLTPNTAYSVVVYEYTGAGIDIDYMLADAPSATNTGTNSTTDVPVHNMDFGVDCDYCHQHSGFGTNGDDGLILSCQNCHADGQVASAKREFSNHTTPKARDGGPHPDGVTYVDCGVCHELHNPSGGNTTWSYNPLTDLSDYNKSFLRANVSKYIPNARDGAFLHNDQPKRSIPNDSGYPETPADTPERAVEGGTDADSVGYCQICHTQTDYHTNNPSVTSSDQCHDGYTGNCGPGSVQQTHCGECHEHNDTFRGKGGSQTCMVCHADETDKGLATRRAIMSEFDNTQPNGSSHIYAGSGSIQEADCLVCHAFSETHQEQFVALYDVDDGTEPRTYFSQTAEEVSAQTPAQGAPLSDHCLSCHGDGVPASLPTTTGDNTQASPFINSGGVTGTLVLNGGDTSLWTSASHNNAAAIGCVGCHVGHGSTEQALLNPNAPQFFPVIEGDPPVSVSDFDTDFCINCHDADGPSTKDIATKLSYTTETVTGVNRNNEALMNNRHDFRQDDRNYSSANIDCKDCHSPHVDNQSAPVRNPDDGNVLPSYDFCNGSVDIAPYNYNSSPDPDFNCSEPEYAGNLDPLNPAGKPNNNYVEPDYIAFCLVCHDNTLPAGSGASMGTPPLDMKVAYFNDANNTDVHGNADGNGASQGYLKFPWTPNGATSDITQGYAALNCTTCHDAHGSGNIFNLRTSITVAGEVMETGGWTGDTIGPIQVTEYFLPPNGTDGQDMYYWGAWCSFCHQMENHGRTETQACNTGHKHGGGNF